MSQSSMNVQKVVSSPEKPTKCARVVSSQTKQANVDRLLRTPKKCPKGTNGSMGASSPKKHANVDIYCTKYNMVFQTVSELQKHESSCFKERRYHCTDKKCDTSFSQKSIMLQHVEGVHKNNPFICSICKETYIFKKVLDAHVKHAHETKKTVYKYVCTICGKGFDNKAHNQIHADWHNDMKCYSCAKCDYCCYST